MGRLLECREILSERLRKLRISISKYKLSIGFGICISLCTYTYYSLLGLIFGSLLSLLVFGVTIFSLVRLILRSSLFPGSLFLWRRYIENSFRLIISKKICSDLAPLLNFVSHLLLREEEGRSTFSTSTRVSVLGGWNCLRRVHDCLASLNNPLAHEQYLLDVIEEMNVLFRDVSVTHRKSGSDDDEIVIMSLADMLNNNRHECEWTIVKCLSPTDVQKTQSLHTALKQFIELVSSLKDFEYTKHGLPSTITINRSSNTTNDDQSRTDHEIIDHNLPCEVVITRKTGNLFWILLRYIRKVRRYMMKSCNKVTNIVFRKFIHPNKPLVTEPTKMRKFYLSVTSFLSEQPLGSLKFLRIDMLRELGGKRYWISAMDGALLDVIHIPPLQRNNDEIIIHNNDNNNNNNGIINNNDIINTNNNNNNNNNAPLIIMCNPNAGYYETSFYAQPNDWLSFYRSRGIGVILYNYRGFGYSEGTPSVSMCKSDSECIIEFVLNNISYKKLGLHGRSVGGIPVCYLAYKYNKYISFLCVDRSFGSLPDTAKYLVGSWSKFFVPKHSNTELFKRNNAYKVIICDPLDTVIDDRASLKSSISYTQLKETFTKTRTIQIRAFIHSYTQIYNVYSLFFHDDSNSLESTLTESINDSLNKRGVFLNNNSSTREFDIFSRDINQFYTTEFLVRFFTPLNSIFRTVYVSILSKLNSAGLTLDDIIIDTQDSHHKFLCFIQNLLFWGSLPPSVPINSTTLHNQFPFKFNHLMRKEAENLIHEINVELKKSWAELRVLQNDTVYPNSSMEALKHLLFPIVSGWFESIQRFFAELDQYIQTRNDGVQIDCPGEAGHLVVVNCGHNGNLTDGELEIMHTHLKESGFVF